MSFNNLMVYLTLGNNHSYPDFTAIDSFNLSVFKFKYNTPIHSLRKIGSGEKSSVVRNLYLSIQYIVAFILIVFPCLRQTTV